MNTRLDLGATSSETTVIVIGATSNPTAIVHLLPLVTRYRYLQSRVVPKKRAALYPKDTNVQTRESTPSRKS